MSTLTVYQTTDAQADGSSGWDGPWSTAWGTGQACTANLSYMYAPEIYYGYDDSGGDPAYYYRTIIRRGLLTFDTTSIDSSAIISSATLSLKASGTSYYGWPGGTVPAAGIYSASPANKTSLDGTAANFNCLGTTKLSDTTKTAAQWTTNSTPNDFAFNSTGLSNITKAGYSCFGIREANFDATNTQPTTGVTSYDFYVSLFGYGQNNLPLYGHSLTVTYTTPVGPVNAKTFKGLAAASVKTVNGVAIASVKTKNGVS